MTGGEALVVLVALGALGLFIQYLLIRAAVLSALTTWRELGREQQQQPPDRPWRREAS